MLTERLSVVLQLAQYHPEEKKIRYSYIFCDYNMIGSCHQFS